MSTTWEEDRAYEERQREIRAAEMAEDDAYETAARERLTGEAFDRRDMEDAIERVSAAGLDVDTERAWDLFRSGEALSVADAVASAVPSDDWKSARQVLGAPIDASVA